MHKAVLVAAVLIATVACVVTGATTSPAQESQAKLMAERLDRAYDALESVPQARAEDVELWITEVSPFFSYEELDPVAGYMGHDFVTVYWELFNTGTEFNHIAGYTYCEGAVALNARMVKKLSTWYTKDIFLGTLIHEAIHNIGGVYCSLDSREAESRTQLGMLEVLAAMANQGNLQALKALVGELRDVASNTYEYELLKADKMAEFIKWYTTVLNPGDAFAEAKLMKSYRFWASDWATLIGILDRYSNFVFQDMADFKYDGWQNVSIAELENFTVKMDDVKYLLDHLEELVESATESPQ